MLARKNLREGTCSLPSKMRVYFFHVAAVFKNGGAIYLVKRGQLNLSIPKHPSYVNK